MQKFDYVVATAERQIIEAQRLRWSVYVEEEGLLCPAVREAEQARSLPDRMDELAATVNLLVYAGDEAVGAVRMTQVWVSSRARNTDRPKAPFAISGLPENACVAVIERFCVRKPFRGTGVIRALYEGLGVESASRSIDYWVALANTQTDCALDASIVYRAAADQGLVSEEVRAQGLRLPCPTSPCSRHVYTAQQREQSLHGAHDRIPLPPPISVFAKRMGGKYVGHPVFDATFGVFLMPLVAKPPHLPHR